MGIDKTNRSRGLLRPPNLVNSELTNSRGIRGTETLTKSANQINFKRVAKRNELLTKGGKSNNNISSAALGESN